MNGMNVMIIGLLALAAFIQLVRANDGSTNKAPRDDDGVDSNDEDDTGPYVGQAYGILKNDADDFADLNLGLDGPDEDQDEYYVEEDPEKTLSFDAGKYGKLLWKTNESPDRKLKAKQDARKKIMPTMAAAYEGFDPSGKHAISMNVKNDWNKNPGNPIYGQQDLERVDKTKCAKRTKSKADCQRCCEFGPGSGIKKFRTKWHKYERRCVCRDSDLSF